MRPRNRTQFKCNVRWVWIIITTKAVVWMYFFCRFVVTPSEFLSNLEFDTKRTIINNKAERGEPFAQQQPPSSAMGADSSDTVMDAMNTVVLLQQSPVYPHQQMSRLRTIDSESWGLWLLGDPHKRCLQIGNGRQHMIRLVAAISSGTSADEMRVLKQISVLKMFPTANERSKASKTSRGNIDKTHHSSNNTKNINDNDNNDKEVMSSEMFPYHHMVRSYFALMANNMHLLDWVVIANDHTFIVPNNLRKFLDTLDSDAMIYSGNKLSIMYRRNILSFASGGAGAVMSHSLIKMMLILWMLNEDTPELLDLLPSVDAATCAEKTAAQASRTVNETESSLCCCFSTEETQREIPLSVPIHWSPRDTLPSSSSSSSSSSSPAAVMDPICTVAIASHLYRSGSTAAADSTRAVTLDLKKSGPHVSLALAYLRIWLFPNDDSITSCGSPEIINVLLSPKIKLVFHHLRTHVQQTDGESDVASNRSAKPPKQNTTGKSELFRVTLEHPSKQQQQQQAPETITASSLEISKHCSANDKWSKINPGIVLAECISKLFKIPFTSSRTADTFAPFATHATAIPPSSSSSSSSSSSMAVSTGKLATAEMVEGTTELARADLPKADRFNVYGSIRTLYGEYDDWYKDCKKLLTTGSSFEMTDKESHHRRTKVLAASTSSSLKAPLTSKSTLVASARPTTTTASSDGVRVHVLARDLVSFHYVCEYESRLLYLLLASHSNTRISTTHSRSTSIMTINTSSRMLTTRSRNRTGARVARSNNRSRTTTSVNFNITISGTSRRNLKAPAAVSRAAARTATAAGPTGPAQGRVWNRIRARVSTGLPACKDATTLRNVWPSSSEQVGVYSRKLSSGVQGKMESEKLFQFLCEQISIYDCQKSEI